MRYALFLALVLAACSSPTAPATLPSSTTSGAVVTAPSGPERVGDFGATPAALDPACPVSQEDVDHARSILRILTGELERSVGMRFTLDEVSAPYVYTGRQLHGYLNYGPAYSWMLLEGTLVKNTLRFGSDQAAGWALWEAAGQLTITADIYVNGVKVVGCTPRVGKITGRIDLDTN